MELEIGVSVEVNRKQYQLIQKKYSWLIGYRKKDGRYFIKPKLFLGYKNIIQNELIRLNNKI
jgi:hypothetical protein